MTSVRKGSSDRTIPHTRFEEDKMIWESYEQGIKLGQGAFGKVFQVRHRESKVDWAMKAINKEKAGSNAVKLLEREVTILKRVSHQNIIQLNEVFETSKRMYLVMELCEGGELADILKEHKYFMESQVKVITKELASAIAYLHKHDIVHRDLKLENILIKKHPNATDPADKLEIKVTDFGLSITKSGAPGHDNMMQDFCGTPQYMAPEIIDNKTYSQQCDIWALGVIVYMLFCGHFPFIGSDDVSLYDLIKKGEIDFKTDDVWKEVSQDAKECIQGMLNVDPAHRLTASEVLDHYWITGVNRQSRNVLTLMKEWKDDIKNEECVEEELETCAINGELESAESAKDDDVPLSPSETNGERQSKSVSPVESGGRKGSGGKKPGSGGKSSSRNGSRLSVGSIPQRSLPSSVTKPAATKLAPSRSPNPGATSRATPSNLGVQSRPVTQKSIRGTATPTNAARQTPSKTMTSTLPSKTGKK